jgi:outer membrane murein-binding lipoprotein Lpp
MKMNFKKVATGAALVSSIIFSAGAASAKDNKHYDRQALAEAQNQLNYDLQHKASRKKLAEDQARIDQILGNTNNDRRDHDRRGGYDRNALANAKNQLNYDLQHKASRDKLAQDQAVIDQIQRR